MTTTNCCSAQWSGLNTAHCSACHETFTTAVAFDMHRRGPHAKNTRHCIPPTEAGLEKAGRTYPCWQRLKAPNHFSSRILTAETPLPG
jgi:hypothetical protein